MAPDAYFEVSVAIAKGAERLGRWRTSLERKRCFKVSKADWQERDQFQVKFFLVRLIRGRATLE